MNKSGKNWIKNNESARRKTKPNLNVQSQADLCEQIISIKTNVNLMQIILKATHIKKKTNKKKRRRRGVSHTKQPQNQFET